ncbi:uncharacterized protein LOC122021898 isoform X2 [Zingiber officinale]|uniref:uncharacterized protein LOC122021898 isoform X2 n=1 Tax=Zingiber officinale TaxID=94328 RepID=UPI001C4B9755|nr:uncharacterized protein LOC122021898 isoform X2 [Zingiber officinale]
MASTKSFRHLLLLLAVAHLSLFRRVIAAARRLLSFVSLRELLLHLSFLRCALRPVTLDLGHASLHIWGPNPRRASRKPALLLIHGFGGNSSGNGSARSGPYPAPSISISRTSSSLADPVPSAPIVPWATRRGADFEEFDVESEEEYKDEEVDVKPFDFGSRASFAQGEKR